MRKRALERKEIEESAVKACSFGEYLGYSVPKFLKSRYLVPMWVYQNSSFEREFQKSRLLEYLRFFGISKAKKGNSI